MKTIFCITLFSTAALLAEQGVGIRTYEIYDQERSRPLTIELWYPISPDTPSSPAIDPIWIRSQEARNAPIVQESSPYPLILLSHGFGANRLSSSWIAEALSIEGFLVAAVDHYGNTFDNMLLEESLTPWIKAVDISKTLDFLLEELDPYIDEKRIGAMGFSQGGAVCLWLGGGTVDFSPILPSLAEMAEELFEREEVQEVFPTIDFQKGESSYLDKRIQALFLMAPGLGGPVSLFRPESLHNISIPVSIVVTGQDSSVPTETNAHVFAQHIPNCSLKNIAEMGDHFLFLNCGTERGKKLIPHFAIDPPGIDREAIHIDITKIATEFFSSYLKK